MKYDIYGTCEHCLWPISGLGHETDKGERYHLSCFEALEKEPVQHTIKLYKVSVCYRGRLTIFVAAHSDDEAMDMACDQAESEVEAEDIEANDADVHETGPSAREIKSYEDWVARKKVFAEREAIRKQQRLAEAAKNTWVPA